MKSILRNLIDLINRFLKDKRIFYYSPNEHNGFGKTAVKTKFGFWYVGDVFDQRDIACGILRYGEIEPDETKLTLKIFEYLKQKQNPIIFDVGVNTGYYGLLATHAIANVTVYSFEPVLDFANCIKESARINGFDKNIHICNFALSNTDGSGQIYVWGTCSSLDKDFNNRDLPSQTIELKKMDNFAKNIAPDFIKIDTEGHELATLQGAIETIKSHRPILFIEIIERLQMRHHINTHYAETIKFLLDIGYEAYRFKEERLERVDGTSTIDGVYMYLFIDKDQHRNLLKELPIDSRK